MIFGMRINSINLSIEAKTNWEIFHFKFCTIEEYLKNLENFLVLYIKNIKIFNMFKIYYLHVHFYSKSDYSI